MLKFMTLAVVVLSPVLVAFAQPQTSSREALFKTLDANQDNRLTRDDLGPAKAELFGRLLKLGDKDEDGALTKEEFLQALPPSRPAADAPGDTAPADAPQAGSQPLNPESIFTRLDQKGNGNGQLELEELPGLLKERLGPAYTTLGKNSMTAEEFVSAYHVLFPEAREQPALPAPNAFFETFDKNKDDKITVDEVPEEFRPRLKQILEQLKAEFMTKEDYATMVERSRRPGTEAASNLRSDVEIKVVDTPPGEGIVISAPPSKAAESPDAIRRSGGENPEAPGPSFFGMLDQDRDGKLSGRELEQASQLVARLDRDGDNLLAPGELFGFGGGQFDRRGRGGPGRGRPDLTARDDNRPERPQRPPIDERPEVDPEQPEPAAVRIVRTPSNVRNISDAELAERIFGRYDSDSDGVLSEDEVPEQLKRNFARIDVDRDGAVSKDELTKGFARRNR